MGGTKGEMLMKRRVGARSSASRALPGEDLGPFPLPREGEGTALQLALFLNIPGSLTVGRPPLQSRRPRSESWPGN